MNIPINLNNQILIKTNKIGDVVSDNMLSSAFIRSYFFYSYNLP